MFCDGMFHSLGGLVMGPLVMGHCVMGHFVMGCFECKSISVLGCHEFQEYDKRSGLCLSTGEPERRSKGECQRTSNNKGKLVYVWI
jgi:hypothetical protein